MFANQQAPAPRSEGFGLNVHSTFFTFQGEGPFAGRPAVFVRLHGCNLQCPQCDTDYTSTSEEWLPELLAKHVVELFTAACKPLVVITGGEPLRQNITPFIYFLQELDCIVQIETNGTLPLIKDIRAPLVNWDKVHFVCSPKTGRVNKSLREHITAYKYVMTADQAHSGDGLPLTALGHAAKPHLARPPEWFPIERIYVQPADPDWCNQNLEACIQSCYEFGYSLCLQQHKIIGVP